MDFRSLIPSRRSSGVTRSGGDDPFTSLRQDMDRFFDDFPRGWPFSATFGVTGFLSPKVDVAETDKGLELTAELPGIDQKDIDLDLVDGVLTIKAEHREEKDERDDKKQYHLVERSYGTFLRRFVLPFEADQDKVEASFDKGVLKVFVPRQANGAKQARKIAIKNG